VIHVPTILFRCVDYYYIFCIHIWCDVNLSLIPCLFVLRRVDELVAEDLGVQQVEVAERSLLKASCALDHFYLPNNVLYNHFIMHRLNFDGIK
jgi:hypothetical protein